MGKQFDLEALVEQRKKAIYNTFGAANLISSESAGGGYSQLEGMSNLHADFIERDIAVIEEKFNLDIIPQLFRLNEWKLTESEMPKIKAGTLAKPSLDEVGKMVQRLASTGFLPKNPEIVNELLERVGLSYRVDKDISDEDFDKLMGEMESSAGKGMEEGMPSGTGAAAGNNSALNSDNAS